MSEHCSDPIKIEFAIKTNSPEHVEAVKSKLISNGLKSNKIEAINGDKETRLIVETNRPWIEIYQLLETTGTSPALTGIGKNSAVSIIDKNQNGSAVGVVRFIQENNSEIVIDGVIDGLQKLTSYQLNICEYGDISDSCKNLGDVYRNSKFDFKSDESGRGLLRTSSSNNLQVPELIGRGVCIQEGDKKIACGIIARSSPVYENLKRICLCSGKVLWDERDIPKIVKL